jgi:hypothetical protein
MGKMDSAAALAASDLFADLTREPLFPQRCPAPGRDLGGR